MPILIFFLIISCHSNKVLNRLGERKQFYSFFLPMDAISDIWLGLASWLQRRWRLKMLTMDDNDGRTTDAWPYYKLLAFHMYHLCRSHLNNGSILFPCGVMCRMRNLSESIHFTKKSLPLYFLDANDTKGSINQSQSINHNQSIHPDKLDTDA